VVSKSQGPNLNRATVSDPGVRDPATHQILQRRNITSSRSIRIPDELHLQLELHHPAEILHNTLLEVGYVGNIAHKLTGRVLAEIRQSAMWSDPADGR